MMRILLTGATGFIGSHLLEKLIALNIPVAILIRKKSDTWRIQEYLSSVIVIYSDISFEEQLSILLSFKPDHLIHLAWYGVENRFRNEYQQLSDNFSYLTYLMQLVEQTSIKKIIGFGSQGEYGPHKASIHENSITHPTTFYGVAKLSTYHFLNLFCQQKNIEFSWIRLFSIFGPKDNSSWFIPSLIKDLLDKKEPALTEGKQRWDFLYVADAIDAMIAILETPHSNGVFNLGSGKSITIKQVAEHIRDTIQPSLSLGFGLIPYRADQVMFLEANIEKLNKVTGWLPKISLHEGIERTIAWCTQS